MKFLENLDRQIATDRLATGWLLMSHAEAIAELVRAAEKVVSNGALVCDEEIELDLALRRLDGEQT